MQDRFPPAPRQQLLAAEGLAVIVVIAALGWAAVVWGPRVGEDSSQGMVHAPWIFAGLQWLLMRLPVWLAGIVLPLAGLGLLGAMPWLGRGQGGQVPRWRWPRGAEWAGWAVVAGWVVLTWLGMG